jgi:hypothetical protein
MRRSPPNGRRVFLSANRIDAGFHHLPRFVREGAVAMALYTDTAAMCKKCLCHVGFLLTTDIWLLTAETRL